MVLQLVFQGEGAPLRPTGSKCFRGSNFAEGKGQLLYAAVTASEEAVQRCWAAAVPG